MNKKIVSILLLAILAMPVVNFSIASASIKDSLCKGSNISLSDKTTITNPDGSTKEVSNTDCNSNYNAKTLDDTISKIINIISVIVGIVAVVMIIIGGFKYITSGGDSNKVTSAKNTIIYAIVGLIVVALAQFIVKFVLSKTV